MDQFSGQKENADNNSGPVFLTHRATGIATADVVTSAFTHWAAAAHHTFAAQPTSSNDIAFTSLQFVQFCMCFG
jgi:hypothetical protein